MATPTINAMYSFDTNVVAILNIKNAIPPIIRGLNLSSTPTIIVIIPATNNIIGGGMISSLIQMNIATKKEADVTCPIFLR